MTGCQEELKAFRKRQAAKDGGQMEAEENEQTLIESDDDLMKYFDHRFPRDRWQITRQHDGSYIFKRQDQILDAATRPSDEGTSKMTNLSDPALNRNKKASTNGSKKSKIPMNKRLRSPSGRSTSSPSQPRKLPKQRRASERNEQFGNLKKWEKEINKTCKENNEAELTVENNVDDRELDSDNFEYVCSLVGVPPRCKDFLVGCECGNSGGNCESNKEKCSCMTEMQGEIPYDHGGILKFAPGRPIYECNDNCSCDKERCINRVVQKGRKIPVSRL